MIDNRDGRMVRRLRAVKPGVTLDKVRADLAVVAARLQTSYPEDYPRDRRLSHARHPARRRS